MVTNNIFHNWIIGCGENFDGRNLKWEYFGNRTKENEEYKKSERENK